MSAAPAAPAIPAPPVVIVSNVPPDAAIAPTTSPASGGQDAGARAGSDAASAREPALSFALASSAFVDGAPLPTAFTCRGADVSPPLTWSGAPTATASFALVLTARARAEKGAAPRVEWVLWDIPAARSELPQGISAGRQPIEVPGAQQRGVAESAPGGFLAGGIAGGVVSAWGRAPGFPVDLPSGNEALLLPRYRGPCGAGELYYEFTLFALDADAPPASSITLESVAESLLTGGNVLARASLSASSP